VEMPLNCGILASIFKNFLGWGMPADPLVPVHLHPRDCCLKLAHLSKNPGSAPWQYAKEKLLPAKDSVEPSFNVSSAVDHFTQTYSNDNANYHSLPSWSIDSLPKCTTSLFDKAPIRVLPKFIFISLHQIHMLLHYMMSSN